MTDLTPEERADRIANSISIYELARDHIRAAEEAAARRARAEAFEECAQFIAELYETKKIGGALAIALVGRIRARGKAED